MFGPFHLYNRAIKKKNGSGVALPPLNLIGLNQFGFSWLCSMDEKRTTITAFTWLFQLLRKRHAAAFCKEQRLGKHVVGRTSELRRWGSSDSLTPRAQKQQTGRVPHLGASFPKLNSPTGEAFRSQPPPWIKCVQFRPPLRTTLKEECLGQISGGGWKVKENNTCLCSWPTDGALMYRLLGNGGVSGYLEASACSGACGKEFCDQKMWGLVWGQKQWGKVQNEKPCQDKGTQSQNDRHLGRLKKWTQNRSHNWIDNWLIPFHLLILSGWRLLVESKMRRTQPPAA